MKKRQATVDGISAVDDTERNLLEASGSFNGRDSSGSEKHGTPGKGRLDRTAASSGRQASEDSLDGAEKGTSQPVRQPLKLRRRRVLPGNLLSSLDRLSELWLESKVLFTGQPVGNTMRKTCKYPPLCSNSNDQHAPLWRGAFPQAGSDFGPLSLGCISIIWRPEH